MQFVLNQMKKSVGRGPKWQPDNKANELLGYHRLNMHSVLLAKTPMHIIGLAATQGKCSVSASKSQSSVIVAESNILLLLQQNTKGHCATRYKTSRNQKLKNVLGSH